MPDAAPKALQYCFRLLGFRGRSEKELLERLRRKGFDRGVSEQALLRLKELGYLDDGAFARSLRREAEEVKLLGFSGARHYLVEKGSPGRVADEALEGYDELAAARKLMEKKLRTMKSGEGEALRRRLYGMMRRRGYSSSAVNKTFKEACL